MSDVKFTEQATSKGGRGGHVKSNNGILDFDIAMPSKGQGTNPEQLFAAAYSTCFDSALHAATSSNKKDIESSTTADVSLLEVNGGNKLAASLSVEVKGVSQEEADKLVEEAHKLCPYSKATRGNIDVELHAKAV